MVEPNRVDTKGAELWVHMDPVVNTNCQQQFRVGWEFERDMSTVMEGDTINVTVFNEPSGDPQGGLRECYVQAKNQMAYGGDVVIELKASGQSHFLYQEAYLHYHQGSGQYLFVVADPTGQVFPVEPNLPARSSTGMILVKDGVHEIGETDAPHGNFSFTISAGSVFTYTVTYLYDAITE